MNRAGLTLLVTSALLATSFSPFASEDAERAVAQSATAAVGVAAGLPVTAVLAEQDAAARAALEAEEAIVSAILDRLTARHTALPARERLAVARAIVREARFRDLEPDLVLAVIEVESAGYHLAVSHVGAMGLMQLLPSTAKELAENNDIEWIGQDMLFDPIVNVKLGTAYLRVLADRYGNVDTALAAYNWGPGRIDRRLRRGSAVPQRYVEQVRRAYDRHVDFVSRRS